MVMVKAKRNLLLIILSVIFALTVVSFVVTRPVKAETPLIAMKETASVRIDPDGRNGIRFTGYVHKDVGLDRPDTTTNEFEADDTYTGIVVAKGAKTVEEMKAYPVDHLDVLDIPAKRMDPARDDKTTGAKAFNAVVWDIAEHNANAQEITAIAYICEAGKYTYSDNVIVRSLAQVASSVIKNDSTVTADDLPILQSYVDGANPVVSVNGVAFEQGVTEMNIEATRLQDVVVSVSPANITPIVESLSSVFTINDNVITPTALAENATAYITVGSTVYTLNIKVNGFVDTELAPGVLADFDEPGYGEQAERINQHKVAWSSGEEFGADSGVVYTVNRGTYQKVFMPLSTPLAFQSVEGFYINVKVPLGKLTNMILNFYDVNGVAIAAKGTTNSNVYLKDITDALYDTNEWTTVYVSSKRLADKFDTSLTVGYVAFYNANENTQMFLDEIGLLLHTTDKDYEDGVLADFNERDYLKQISYDLKGWHPNVLTGDDAAAVGADSGVLYVNAQASGYGEVMVKLNEKLVLNNVAGVYVRIKYTASLTNIRMTFRDEDKNMVLGPLKNNQTSYPDNGYVYIQRAASLLETEVGAWMDIFVPIEIIKAYTNMAGTEEITYIGFNNTNSTGHLYIDEIYTNAKIYNDTNIGENVLADFDETGYSAHVYATSTSGSNNASELAYGSLGATYGVDSGVARLRSTSSYLSLLMRFTKTVKPSEIDYIYVKVKASRVLNDANGIWMQFLDINGKAINGKAAHSIPSMVTNFEGDVANEWQTLIIPASKIASVYGANADLGMFKLYTRTVSANVVVDEIGYGLNEVSVNGQVLSSTEVNNVNIVAGSPVAVTSTLDTPVLSTSGSAIKVSGNTMTASSWMNVSQQITVTSYGKTYTINATVVPWKDTNLADGMLFDFDEAEYMGAVTHCGSGDAITNLSSWGQGRIVTGMAGANGGVYESDPFTYKASANYTYIGFGLAEEIDASTIASITIRIKTTLAGSDFRIRLKTAGGGSCCTLTQLGLPKATADENGWLTVTLSSSALKITEGEVSYIVLSLAHSQPNPSTLSGTEQIWIDYISMTTKA